MKIWTHRVANDEDFTEAVFAEISVMKGLRLTARIALAETWPRPTLRLLTSHPPADAFLCGPMEVVSERLRGVLSAEIPASDIEFLPVDIEGASGRFFYCNPLGFVDVLDRDEAEYTEERGIVHKISKLAVDESKVGERSLVALDAIASVWVVSDALAQKIHAAGIRGIAFESPDKWVPF